jgi:TPR repeat protein
MYYDGKGIGTDYVKAIQWFVKSAEQGNSYAQSMLDSSRIDLKKDTIISFRDFLKNFI